SAVIDGAHTPILARPAAPPARAPSGTGDDRPGRCAASNAATPDQDPFNELAGTAVPGGTRESAASGQHADRTRGESENMTAPPQGVEVDHIEFPAGRVRFFRA